jgi:preprotein translocase subunit SecE
MSAEKLEQEGRRRRRLFGQRNEPEEVDDAEELDEEENRGITASKGRATPSRRQQEEEEDHRSWPVKTRDSVLDYLDGVRSEMDKVVWPTREEAQRLTIIVIATLIAASLVLGAISVIFTELFTIGLNRPVILLAVVLIALVAGVVVWRTYSRRASTSPY